MMVSHRHFFAALTLAFGLVAYSPPAGDASENASATNITPQVANVTSGPLQNDGQIEASANATFEGGSLDADAPVDVSEADVPCNARDVSLYTQLRQDVDANARQQALAGGGPDFSPAIRLTKAAFAQMTPRCVDLLGKLAQAQRVQIAREVPEWLTRPMGPCECHGSVCSTCEGVNP